MTDWCILRMAGASTLRVAQSLREAGFDVWTPVEEIRKAVRGKFEWVAVPMLPTFVFAEAVRMTELIALSRSPAQTYQVWDREQRRMVAKGCPPFRLFHIGDGYGTVPDAELMPLRRIEGRRKRKPRGKPRDWNVGDPVRFTDGAYEGLRGKVVEVMGKQVRVLVPGSSLSFVVSAHLPMPDLDEPRRVKVNGAQPEPKFRAAA